VHAIGDRAVEETVEGFAKALAGKDNRTLRHRIEHVSLLTRSSIEKMAALNLIASVQPQFVVSDFWTIDRVGKERYRYAYPFKTLADHGIPLAMGSDCPVEIINPFQLIYRAATRDVYSRSESLSPIQTLRAYCLGSAYASFDEDIKGSLEPGKLADFVVLSTDILECDLENIEGTRVLSTYIGGKQACGM
jgi:predicted amidohydrolase YtcJ